MVLKPILHFRHLILFVTYFLILKNISFGQKISLQIIIMYFASSSVSGFCGKSGDRASLVFYTRHLFVQHHRHTNEIKILGVCVGCKTTYFYAHFSWFYAHLIVFSWPLYSCCCPKLVLR